MQSPRPSPALRRCAAPLAVVASSLLAGYLPAQTAPTEKAAAEGEVVRMSEFTVSTDRDYGYRASNSIAGTRTNTPIKDIPMNIQVFTKDLADDLLIKNQVDFEAYNASLVNGGADRFSDNPIQQSYQNFLFRGFRQNWGLRDGIREYDPIDTQGLARVEVVKGPAAPLYGLAYPGGVMNNISKAAEFGRNFGQIRISGGGEGDYRATIDANVHGDLAGGKLAIRYNGAYEKTEDVRAHSEGEIKLNVIDLAWAPTTSTLAEFKAERGYRSKPNGLQAYFETGEAGASGNFASIPLQILRPNIPWTWNWANEKNQDSLETRLYRGKITQKIGEDFQVQGYVQYSRRLEIPGNGWDANGSGGANAWESSSGASGRFLASSSGWDQATDTIRSTYHYRDWGNSMHAYGATGVYKLDLDWVKNTFAFGANVWSEDEEAKASRPIDPNASAMVYPVRADIPIVVPLYPPADTVPEWEGGPNGNGYHHENNSNDYYFLNWQASWLGERLKTNVGVNRTKMKLLGWNNGASPSPDTVYTASKVSPMAGVVYAITNEVSVFGVYSTSLFPDSTKDSFGNTFSPQVGKSWEGGVKVDLADGKLSGTVSVYQITQTGGSQNDPNHDNLTTQRWDSLTPAQRAADPQFAGKTRGDFLGDIIQGGEQRSRGFDVDLVYQPMRQWQIVASYAYVNHEFTESAIAETIGQTYPQAIKNRWALLTKYSFTDGPLKNFMVGMGISGGTKSLQNYVTFQGKTYARYEPGRTTVELFGGYKFKFYGYNAMVQLNVKNLTQTPDYTGWKATGSSSILSTERYEVPTPVVYRLTVGLDF